MSQVEQTAASRLLRYTHLTLTMTSPDLPSSIFSSQKYIQKLQRRIREENFLFEVGWQGRPQEDVQMENV